MERNQCLWAVGAAPLRRRRCGRGQCPEGEQVRESRRINRGGVWIRGAGVGREAQLRRMSSKKDISDNWGGTVTRERIFLCVRRDNRLETD